MSPRVLIIDDHPEFRELLGHHITAEWPRAQVVEHDPLTAGCPDGALLAEGRYDVVLLDYRLGEDNGLDWLAKMREESDCPPIIFLTAAGDEILAVRAIKAGAEDYIPKSRLSNSLLVNAMRSAIRAREAASRPLVPPAPQPPDEVPADAVHVKGYRIVGQIAARGPSTIYIAERGDEKVALKVLRNAGEIDHDKLERFLQECEVISHLRHPNVVRIFDHGVADELVYIAMEYFPEGDLKTRLRAGIDTRQAGRYLRDIASALEAIHEVGVLHRDLKPANAMVREDDSIALIDFGHAKHMWMEAALTEPGEVFGTPYYMSPEQGHGDPVDRRSDIYSLGVLFYEMLTGRKPYTAASPMAVIYKHSHAAVPALPSALAPLQPLIDRTMAKQPRDRFQSAAELLDFLGASERL